MNTSKIGFTAFLRHSFVCPFIIAGVVASQSASAAYEGAAAYNGKIVIPGFVPDVRELIIKAASRHTWQVVEEKPGELTLQLNHAKSHTTVIAKAFYTKSDFWFEKVGVKFYECPSHIPCRIDAEMVQRWMLNLRREAGVKLLELAIQDASGIAPVL